MSIDPSSIIHGVGGSTTEDLDVEAMLAQVRAERDLFERKHLCEMAGQEFVPTEQEQTVLDAIDKRVSDIARRAPSPEERARRERHAQADELETQMAYVTYNEDPVGEQRVRARIAELRAS